MTTFEKTEIEKLDSKYRPIGAWGILRLQYFVQPTFGRIYMFVGILLFRFQHKQAQLCEKFLLRGVTGVDCCRIDNRSYDSFRFVCGDYRTDKKRNATAARLINCKLYQ